MSALPVIEPIVEPAPRTRTAPRTLPRFPEPIIIELPRPKTRRGKVQKVQAQKRASIVGQIAGFTVIAGIAFGTLSLAGQVMVEKARRDSIRAAARARQSSRVIADLRGDVQALTSSRSIDEWAAANGFIPTDSAPKATGVIHLAAIRN
jgi:hypothetical protein